MTLDGCYRLSPPQATTSRSSRDVIIRFQNGPDSQAFLSAVRSASPYHFEEHSLPFYPDISRATMDWRRSL
ncbi:Hypothetical predicted protein [Pelobates cultripes]|uniref:Uncharacterized protein n=1 Tax=Pelobates cultripes TaxID=61616 RepID=A0AAD1VKN5_PELCU|nr:Hypothetical predicted protein [Pelobates cultripes]